ANQLAGSDSRAVSLKNLDGVNATAYAGQKGSQLLIAAFNKDSARDITIALRVPEEYRQSKVWRLTGPALDATQGITLAGAEMSATSSWTPTSTENLRSTSDGIVLELPKSSAAIVFLNA